nr:LuxR C-terminal-related transcriptional regulator [Mycolicibacterium tusciae]
MTPTELDVVRLGNEGLANQDVATRLFISPRTVQTYLRDSAAQGTCHTRMA